MKVVIAKGAGYCFGVERALNLAQQSLKNSINPLWTFGSIIHNPQVVEFLKEKGLSPVKNLDEISTGTIIISSHGVSPGILRQARKKGIKIIDATCPYVKKAQFCASELVKENYNLVVVGDPNHPEVKGILAHAGKDAEVIEKVSDVKRIKPAKKIGVVVQTTQSPELLQGVVSDLVLLTSDLKVFNTICDATAKKQEAAQKLARQADVMLVVGGRNSANTTRLAQICEASETPTYHIEVASEIDFSWFREDSLVGITTGASTPDWILSEVIQQLDGISRNISKTK